MSTDRTFRQWAGCIGCRNFRPGAGFNRCPKPARGERIAIADKIQRAQNGNYPPRIALSRGGRRSASIHVKDRVGADSGNAKAHPPEQRPSLWYRSEMLV